MIEYHWKPIDDLSSGWAALASPDLPPLLRLWRSQADILKTSAAFKIFMDRLRREIAVETGILERLYTLDRGLTTMLIERGIDEAIISHGKADRPAAEIIALIRDQEAAVQSIFDFVKDARPLSTSYIKELHALLTRHQPTTSALHEETGNVLEVQLLRGDWKKRPNNPKRTDGTLHEYAPPEHVASEMDRLIGLYHTHEESQVAPEVQAAWLHHAFTAIHPFQDGNGRVARCLASLVFIKQGWFPLTIRDDDRNRYLDALELADDGDLRQLISFFAERQRQTLIHALSLSDQVLNESRQAAAVLSSVRLRLQRQEAVSQGQRSQRADRLSDLVREQTISRFEALRREIRASLAGVVEANVFVGDAAAGESERSWWHTIPIVTIAKRLGYYANRRTYAAWVDLNIIIDQDRTELLVSIHGLGGTDNGTRLCTAIGYRKQHGEDNSTVISDVEPLSETPFQFSHLDEDVELGQRFNRWLEEIVVSGLNYWQRTL